MKKQIEDVCVHVHVPVCAGASVCVPLSDALPSTKQINRCVFKNTDLNNFNIKVSSQY